MLKGIVLTKMQTLSFITRPRVIIIIIIIIIDLGFVKVLYFALITWVGHIISAWLEKQLC